MVSKVGFHSARVRLRGPQQPSNHTQDVTGCLDVEQGSGQGGTGGGGWQRSGQEGPNATGRGEHDGKAPPEEQKSPQAGQRHEEDKQQLKEDNAGPTPEGSSQSQIQPRTKTVKPKTERKRAACNRK